METANETVKGGGLWGADLFEFESLPSTNSWMLKQAGALRHGDVVHAVRQSAGQGRLGRTWVSPGRCCLTASILLKPPTANPLPSPLLLPTAAIGVRDTLAEFGLASMLKWPNDVMVSNRKICGILAETTPDGDGIVLGIGINVNITAPALAGMTFEQAPTSMAVERERLFDIGLVRKRLLIDVEKAMDAAWRQGAASVAARWQEGDHLAGKTITLKGESGAITGLYIGMRESGEICIKDAAGKEHLFWSGDVSVAANVE